MDGACPCRGPVVFALYLRKDGIASGVDAFAPITEVVDGSFCSTPTGGILDVEVLVTGTLDFDSNNDGGCGGRG